MTTKHDWSFIDSGSKTREEHINVLKKYGIASLIHSRCKKIQERSCSNCKKTVCVSQLDENDKTIIGTMVVRNIDFKNCIAD